MADSNILISALLFPNGRVAATLKKLLLLHRLCVASYSLDEVERVVRRKFPRALNTIDSLLSDLSYEIIRTPDILADTPEIRDYSDRPILASALLGDIDILLTGDKDFSDISIERPQIMTPAQFAAVYL